MTQPKGMDGALITGVMEALQHEGASLSAYSWPFTSVFPLGKEILTVKKCALRAKREKKRTGRYYAVLCSKHISCALCCYFNLLRFL